MFTLFSCNEIGNSLSSDIHLTIINSQNKHIKFNIEIAKTQQSRTKGLMNRKSLARNDAMLFVFDAPQKIAMWMKNTLIPLDMIFIDSEGVIKKIAKNNQPHDLTPVYSDFRVLGVLEINAGLSDYHLITQGDVVKHDLFSQNK